MYYFPAKPTTSTLMAVSVVIFYKLLGATIIITFIRFTNQMYTRKIFSHHTIGMNNLVFCRWHTHSKLKIHENIIHLHVELFEITLQILLSWSRENILNVIMDIIIYLCCD